MPNVVYLEYADICPVRDSRDMPSGLKADLPWRLYMAMETEQKPWELLSYEEKNLRLFLKQKALLKTFLDTGALSKEQYDKSFHDLTEKMERKLLRA